jgi:cell division protein ZapA
VSNEASNKVSVLIMGKEYQIACSPEEQNSLIQAALHLDKQMRAIRENGKVIGLERIAIMTALNLSHELLQAQSQNSSHQSGSEEQLSRVNQKLDSALARFKQLEM